MAGTPIGDELASEWHAAENFMRRVTHPHFGHHDAPQPAAAPQNPPVPHNDNQEVPPMSLLAEIEDHLKTAVTKFENVDHEALDVLDRVQANPATAEIFAIAGQLTHLPPTTLATGVDVLRMVLTAASGQATATPAPEPQAVPAGPVTGGVA